MRLTALCRSGAGALNGSVLQSQRHVTQSCSTSRERMGSAMMGPLPCIMSKGMFMPASGVRMSENRITPSGRNASHGCSEISTCSAQGDVRTERHS